MSLLSSRISTQKHWKPSSSQHLNAAPQMGVSTVSQWAGPDRQVYRGSTCVSVLLPVRDKRAAFCLVNTRFYFLFLRQFKSLFSVSVQMFTFCSSRCCRGVYTRYEVNAGLHWTVLSQWTTSGGFYIKVSWLWRGGDTCYTCCGLFTCCWASDWTLCRFIDNESLLKKFKQLKEEGELVLLLFLD